VPNVTGSLKLTTSFQQAASGLPGNQTASLSVQQSPACNFSTSGTAADQCDLKHTKTYSFVASTAQTIDLTALTDVFGNAVSFVKVRSITFIFQGTTDGASLTLGNAASNAWTGFLNAAGTLTIYPSSASNSGIFALTAPNTGGMPVSGTSKSLKMAPSAHNFNVDIEIAGTSA
jgi:hypothetical protein